MVLCNNDVCHSYYHNFFYKLSAFIMAQNFLLSVPLCILISLIFISLITMLFIKKTNLFTQFFKKCSMKLIIFATIILLILQIFVSWNSYFLSGWDVRQLINNAFDISNGKVDSLNNSYFSRYPNNLLIEYIFVTIFKFAKFIGIGSLQNRVFLIIILQCILSSLSGLLVFKTLFNFTQNHMISWTGWIFYILLIGTSPWVMIPYSDSMTLIFPILITWIWSLLKNNRYTILKWTLIAAISYIGYKLKPQIIITLIAIIIIQFLYTKFSKEGVIHLLKCAIPMAISVVILNFAVSGLTTSLPFQLDPNLELGLPHFLMQGLNEQTAGIFSIDDQHFSLNYPTTQERTKANLEESARRFNKLGPSGLIKLATTKTASNYANGVFGWSQEGLFYAEILPDKSAVSPILKDTLYIDGKYYKVFAIIKQIIWFSILILSLFSLCGKDKAHMKGLLLVALAIIGLTIFETIFEPRARYFYSYAPMYIILAAVGWRNITYKIRKLIK